MNETEILTVTGSPHAHAPHSTSWCMWQVSIALLPAVAVALWQFGLGAAIVIAVSIAGCMLTEWAINRFMLRRSCTLLNGSAFLTGLLLALNVPSNLPVWTILIGCVAAIGIGKMAFGGLGCNIFNPALVGRVFLLLSFPMLMTSWPVPGQTWSYVDAITGPTALGGAASTLQAELYGQTGGSLGEVGGIALLLGFAWLLMRRVITWHIPVAILVTVALMALLVGSDPAMELLGGGLLLGAIFMATDYVTSPMTGTGMLIYGVLIGVLTIVIRHWGAYPEGVSFAILLGNAVTPLLNRSCRPRRFAEERRAAR